MFRTAGTNCDLEATVAFQKAGADVESLHIKALIAEPVRLDRFHILCIPGGFSYGDDLGAGRILGNELKVHLGKPVARFVESGRLVLGICNGFQVLVKAGFLPGLRPGGGEATLTFNDSHRFEDRWIRLRATSKRCPAFANPGDVLEMPIAHGEGKFVPADEQLLEVLRKNDQIVFRYEPPAGEREASAEEIGKGVGEAIGHGLGGTTSSYPWNPNGSIDDIAGLCDPTGRILGLMPHPERHAERIQHPRWTRADNPVEAASAPGDGMRVFENAVAFIRAHG